MMKKIVNNFSHYDDYDIDIQPIWRDRFDRFSWKRWFRKPRVRFQNGYEQVFDYRSSSWIFKHRQAAEQKLGTPLPPGTEVHHINGDKLDNRPENLAILPKDVHRLIHKQARELATEKGMNYLSALVRIYALNMQYDISINIKSLELNRIQKEAKQLKSLKAFLSKPSSSLGGFGYSRGSGCCPRCGGSGYLPQYSHVAGGVCFLCGGGGDCDYPDYADFDHENEIYYEMYMDDEIEMNAYQDDFEYYDRDFNDYSDGYDDYY